MCVENNWTSGKMEKRASSGNCLPVLVVPGVAAQVDTRHKNARNNARSAAMRGTPAFTTPHGLVDGGGPVSRVARAESPLVLCVFSIIV